MSRSKSGFSFKKLLKISAGLVAGYTFWFLMLIVALRWVNPPVTSFTLQEDWDNLTTENYNLRKHWVDDENLPDHLKWAVVASEDQRFWEHHGIDLVAIGKALEEKREEGRVRGASTISQQVSKNLFLWSGQNYLRKGLEAGITLTIEVLWPKERILEMYLNIAEFGPGVYGAGKATDTFFDKPVTELAAEESARLAAVLPNPKKMRVNPPSPYVTERKKWILRNMTQLSGESYYSENNSRERALNTTPKYADSLSIERRGLADFRLQVSESDTSHTDND